MSREDLLDIQFELLLQVWCEQQYSPNEAKRRALRLLSYYINGE